MKAFLKDVERLKQQHSRMACDGATKIPTYLTKIKAELEDDRRRELERLTEPDVPEGYRVGSVVV